MVFHLSLSDNKSPRVSMTFLSILVDLDNTVVWIFSIRPLILNSSGTFTMPLGIVPRAAIIIGIIVTFMLHSFLVLRQGLRTCLYFHFLWFSLYGFPFSIFLIIYYQVWSSGWD